MDSRTGCVRDLGRDSSLPRRDRVHTSSTAGSGLSTAVGRLSTQEPRIVHIHSM